MQKVPRSLDAIKYFLQIVFMSRGMNCQLLSLIMGLQLYLSDWLYIILIYVHVYVIHTFILLEFKLRYICMQVVYFKMFLIAVRCLLMARL